MGQGEWRRHFLSDTWNELINEKGTSVSPRSEVAGDAPGDEKRIRLDLHADQFQKFIESRASGEGRYTKVASIAAVTTIFLTILMLTKEQKQSVFENIHRLFSFIAG
jgi:hypothetical protein